MSADLWRLYEQMLRSRLFEEAVAALWHQGLISGEMHLAIGEEGIAAGTVLQLREGDALALDHRGTPQMLMRGVDGVDLMQELLGLPEGLTGGMGGHMHLFSREHLAASSGIVGASGPAGVGFALAAQRLRPTSVVLAYFGEGAVNEGMLMESLNLAVIWRLPVLFICKDNNWSITTPSDEVFGGELVRRVEGFGLPVTQVDGADVLAVWRAAAEAIEQARAGRGPSFLHARCRHFEHHFLGYQLAKLADAPHTQLDVIVGVIKSLARRRGAGLLERVSALHYGQRILRGTRQESRAEQDDPLVRARQRLVSDALRLARLEEGVVTEIHDLMEEALAPLMDDHA
ncbi:MAG: thiamine pyrophosphate-dependent dehydrogenase E1 component subunit alpha [Candidatus Promineifilaceae bacterium]|nr:thiamine pyrophosphate-dependent dehydrogenase E1 component subunit alpha [Candidatus Promineifilaceae bacterium]